jgi:Holliday junction resolvasome RuvABC endonuclease subunit
MDNPTILTLDLGTKTGWALRSSDTLITSGTVAFRHDRYQGGGMRFLRFKHWLDGMLATVTRIDAIYFEEVRRHLGVDAAHAYGGFLAHLSAWCEQHEIAYEGVPVGTIKRHVTGKGNAGKAKVIQAVRQRGHHPADDNEADALALLHWVIDTRLGGAT